MATIAKTNSQIAVNAAKLDAKDPIPLETGGRGYSLLQGRQYVPFFDNGNNFFQVLTEASLLSPTNIACVNSKTKFSIGMGLMLMDEVEDTEFKKWAKSVNKKGESFNEIISGAFNHRYNVGNLFVEIVRIKIGSTRYIKLFLKNYNDCRLETPKEGEDDIPTHVIVSQRFRKKGSWTIGSDNLISIPLYTGEPDQKWYKDEKGYEHAIIHVKNKMPGYDYYGMPSNVACLPQQILEYKMSRYNMDNFDNNLVIGGLIVLQGNMSPDESKKVAKEITTAHTGDGKRGKYVILSSENGVENSKVINFEQNKEYDYINGSKRVEEQILLANEWSKALIDPTVGGIGNSGKQIRDLYETKMNTVIKPEQQYIIEKLVQPIMAICDQWMGTKWSAYNFGFDSIPILGIGSDVDANAVLTVNEGREILGYEAFGGEAGQQRIKDSKQLNLNVGNA